MEPMGRLRGRVGIVTGAESTVGREIARTLASEGMSLMLIARPGSHVRDLAESLAESHAIRCFPAALDVTDPAAVDRIVMHAEQHVGTIDVLVNTVDGRIAEALLPTMEQRGRGHIIDVEPAHPALTSSAVVTVALPSTGEVGQAVLDAVSG